MRTLIAFSAAAAALAATPAAAQDAALAPQYETIALEAGFAPDPRTLRVDAGGAIDVEADAALLEAGCRGHVDAAPDVVIDYAPAAAPEAPLVMFTRSQADPTLVVRTPSGAWLCDDDAGEVFNPLLVIDAPEAGAYQVWVGIWFARAHASRFLDEPSAPADLYITGVAPEAPAPAETEGDAALEEDGDDAPGAPDAPDAPEGEAPEADASEGGGD